jgi:hypothetical protein
VWPQSVFRNSAALKMKIKLLHRSRECIRALDSMPVQAFWQTRRFRKILIVVTGLAAFITHYSQDRLQRMLHHAATTAQASDRSLGRRAGVC